MMRCFFLLASVLNFTCATGAEHSKNILSRSSSCSCGRLALRSCAVCCKMTSWGSWCCSVTCMLCPTFSTFEPLTVFTRSLNRFSQNAYYYAQNLEKILKDN